MRRLIGMSIAVATFFVGSVSPVWAVDVVVLGGESAVSSDVVWDLAGCVDGSIERIAGANRFETAAEISRWFEPAGSAPWSATALVATGHGFPDALAGGALAARSSWRRPVLLVGDSVPAVVHGELSRLGGTLSIILGGTAVVPDSVASELEAYGRVKRFAGSDRYETAAVVARQWVYPTSVYVTTGSNFPDALSGVAAAGRESNAILLVTKDSIPRVVAKELDRLDPHTIRVLGGESAISAAVFEELKRYSHNAVRLAGSDRYGTSVAISQDTYPDARYLPDTIVIATGEAFPDALAGGPLASKLWAPLLLVRHGSVPDVVIEEIERITGIDCTPVEGNPALICQTTDLTISSSECEALERLYFAMGRKGTVGSWFTAPDPCTWTGITCQDQHVVELAINSHSGGTIPPGLGDLDHLQTLTLGPFEAGFTLTSGIGELTSLLNLRFNYYWGLTLPPEIGNLTQLETFSATAVGEGFCSEPDFPTSCSNYGINALPEELWTLTSLTSLDLQPNNIGYLSPNVGNLTNLRTLYLAENALSGEVPIELWNLTNLNSLRLYGQTVGSSLGCLTASDPDFADWLTSYDADWNDGC